MVEQQETGGLSSMVFTKQRYLFVFGKEKKRKALFRKIF